MHAEIYGWLLTNLLAFGMVKITQMDLPSISIDSAGFDATLAWSHLIQIARDPHPFGSFAHSQVRSYISAQLEILQKAAISNGLNVSVYSNDSSRTILKQTRPEYLNWEFESENLAFVIGGGATAFNETDKSDAILVSAHFDSAFFSHGAADDGLACAAMLEIIRVLVSDPNSTSQFKRPLIFLFNSPEEIGLLGAISFVSNGWNGYNVGVFVNLEAAGVSGREFLFRALGSDIIALFASVSTSPHANVIGNDVFNLGVVSGDTDFRVYAKEKGVPGLDFAFYENRPFYHTLYDDIGHVDIKSLQHVGRNVIAVAKAAATRVDKLQKGSLASVFYDVTGSFMVSYSFGTSIAISSSLIFLTLSRVKWSRNLGKSFFLIFASFFGGIGVSAILAELLAITNAAVIYSFPWLIVLLIFAVVCLVPIMLFRFTPDLIESDVFDGLEMFFVFFQMFNIILNSKQVGMLFFTSWWHFFLISSRIILCIAFQPRREGYRSLPDDLSIQMGSPAITTYSPLLKTLKILVQLFMPLAVSFDFGLTIVETVGAGVSEGGSPVFVLCFYAFICGFSAISFLPYLSHLTRKLQSRAIIIFSTLSIVLFITAISVFPFTAQKPLRSRFQQFYNMTDDQNISSTILLRSAFPEYARNAIIQSQFVSSGNCIGYVCQFPVLYSQVQLPQSVINWKPEITFNSDARTVSIDITFPENIQFCLAETMCKNCTWKTTHPFEPPLTQLPATFEFSDPFGFGGSRIGVGYLHPDKARQDLIYSQVGFLRRRQTYNETVTFEMQWSVEDQNLTVFTSCFIDEYGPNFLPHLLTLHRDLPDWSLLMSTGTGMVSLFTETHIN